MVLSLRTEKVSSVMKKDKLLWVDDEISLLRPHILFLKGKGYEVDTVPTDRMHWTVAVLQPMT